MTEIDQKNQHILATAARHFATQGFGSARMDEIAADANVNKATIYYRIGDKEALYEEVYGDILDKLLQKLAQNCHDLEDPILALRTFIRTIATVCVENPDML